MPASLLASQFETLEPLEHDERGITIDVDQDIDSIVDDLCRVNRRARNRTGEPMTSHAGLQSPSWQQTPSCPSRSPPAGSWCWPRWPGIALIVVLITVAKLHPFLALIFGALTVGIVAGMNFADVLGLVRRRVRHHRGGRRHPDRARRDVRQAARGFRRRRRDRRHHRRPCVAARAAVGDGAGRLDHRPADVLRDRPRPADAGHLSGGQAVAAVPDHHRNPRAGRPFRDARAGATAPRSADRHRPAWRRSGHHPGARCRRGDPDGHRRRPAVRQAGRALGRRRRAGPLQRRRLRRPGNGGTALSRADRTARRAAPRPSRSASGAPPSASRCSAFCSPSR